MTGNVSSLWPDQIASLEQLRQIVAEHPSWVHEPLASGRTVVEWALAYRDVSWLRLLLAHGANPQQRTADGETLMHEAVHGENVAAMATLVESGASVHTTNHAGRTPWQTAVIYGRPKSMQWLAEHAGASVETEAELRDVLAYFIAPDHGAHRLDAQEYLDTHATWVLWLQAAPDALLAPLLAQHWPALQAGMWDTPEAQARYLALTMDQTQATAARPTRARM